MIYYDALSYETHEIIPNTFNFFPLQGYFYSLFSFCSWVQVSFTMQSEFKFLIVVIPYSFHASSLIGYLRTLQTITLHLLYINFSVITFNHNNNNNNKKKRLEDCEKKVLHGQYLSQTKKVSSDQCWAWLQNEDLKRETESLIVAAQNQSIRTNLKQRLTKAREILYAEHVEK